MIEDEGSDEEVYDVEAENVKAISELNPEDFLEERLYEVPCVKLSCPINDVVFHPTVPVFVAGLVNSNLTIHLYHQDLGLEDHSMLDTLSDLHKRSIRSLAFDESGDILISGDSGGNICYFDFENAKTIHRYRQPGNECGITKVSYYDKDLFATSDDNGCITLWDIRTKNECGVFTEHGHDWEGNKVNGYVTDMLSVSQENLLFACGSDGYFSAWDVRKRKLNTMSVPYDDEFNCLALVGRGEQQVLTGSLLGTIGIWNWDIWKHYKSSLPGHPKSIESMVTYRSNTVFTGCVDGLIRGVQIDPKSPKRGNKLLGVIGDHGSGQSVSVLKLSADTMFLCSAGYDGTIKFWKVGEEVKKFQKPKELVLQEDVEEEVQEGVQPEEEKDILEELGDWAEELEDSDLEQLVKGRKGGKKESTAEFFDSIEPEQEVINVRTSRKLKLHRGGRKGKKSFKNQSRMVFKTFFKDIIKKDIHGRGV